MLAGPASGFHSASGNTWTPPVLKRRFALNASSRRFTAALLTAKPADVLGFMSEWAAGREGRAGLRPSSQNWNLNLSWFARGRSVVGVELFVEVSQSAATPGGGGPIDTKKEEPCDQFAV